MNRSNRKRVHFSQGDDEKHPVTRNKGRSHRKEVLLSDLVNGTSHSCNVLLQREPIVTGLTHNGMKIPSKSVNSGQHMKKESKKAVEFEAKHFDTSVDHESAKNIDEIQKEREVINRTRKRRRPPIAADAVDDLRRNVTKVLKSRVAQDVETVVARTSGNVFDDERPLSAWLEGAHTSLTADGRVPLAGTAGLCDETGERQNQNKKRPAGQTKEKAQENKDEKTPADYVSHDNNAPERHDEIPVLSTATVPVNNEDLPFVKTSLIWEMIESMEVFKRIPQKPHFRPLYNYKEECREGLAVGNMVNFASLVDRVSRLRFGDPKSLIDGYMEALVDLEEMGFNVEPVREQLNKLLALKSRQELARNTSKETESQILEREHEKSKMREEIAELDKKIEELHHQRALVVSRKEMKDGEIALLQSSLDAVKGSLKRAEEEFEKVAASLG